MEVEKAKIAEKYGADTLMDLSVGGDITGHKKGRNGRDKPAGGHGAPL